MRHPEGAAIARQRPFVRPSDRCRLHARRSGPDRPRGRHRADYSDTDRDRHNHRIFHERHQLAASMFVGAYFGMGATATAMLVAIQGWDDAQDRGAVIPALCGTPAEAAAIDIAGLDALRQPGVRVH